MRCSLRRPSLRVPVRCMAGSADSITVTSASMACAWPAARISRADVIIGADGATSQIAQDAGLVDPARVPWGFALRGYADAAVDLPQIALWEPRRWRLFPGYGWIFPVPGGPANIRLGVGRRACRGESRRAGEQLDAFLSRLRRHGLLPPSRGASGPPMPRLGRWLKLPRWMAQAGNGRHHPGWDGCAARG